MGRNVAAPSPTPDNCVGFGWGVRVNPNSKGGFDPRHADAPPAELHSQDVAHLNEYMLLTAKPVVYVINLSENDYKRKKNKYLPKIHAWVQQQAGGGIMIPYSGMLSACCHSFDMLTHITVVAVPRRLQASCRCPSTIT